MRYILVLLFSITYTISFAQTKLVDSLKNTHKREFSNICLKTSPLVLLLGPMAPITSEYRIMLETNISKKSTILLGASYLGKNLIWLFSESQNTLNQTTLPLAVNGFRIQVSYRYYFGKNYLRRKSFYIAPIYSYSKCIVTSPNYNSKTDYLDITHQFTSLLFGRQTYLGSKFSLDFYLGFGYKNNNYDEYVNGVPYSRNNEDVYTYKKHFKANAGVNLGLFL